MKRNDEQTKTLSDWEYNRLEAEAIRQQIELDQRERFLEQRRREENDQLCEEMVYQRLEMPTYNSKLYMLFLYVEARDTFLVLLLVALAGCISFLTVNTLLQAIHVLTPL